MGEDEVERGDEGERRPRSEVEVRGQTAETNLLGLRQHTKARLISREWLRHFAGVKIPIGFKQAWPSVFCHQQPFWFRGRSSGHENASRSRKQVSVPSKHEKAYALLSNEPLGFR